MSTRTLLHRTGTAQRHQRGRWRRRAGAVVLTALMPVLVGGGPAPALAAGDYGPDTCLQGWVWRGATPTDRVCVTPAVRAQTAADNAQAAARRSPGGGAYGPDTCRSGWVWREAVPGDRVCVTGVTRTQAARDNAQAAARRNSLRLTHTRYFLPAPPPVCDGDTCTVTSTDDAPRIRLHGDRVNVGLVRVELRRLGDNAVLGRWTVRAVPARTAPGGRFSLDTGRLDCRRAGDSWFRVQDTTSGRWSGRYPVSSRCAVL